MRGAIVATSLLVVTGCTNPTAANKAASTATDQVADDSESEATDTVTSTASSTDTDTTADTGGTGTQVVTINHTPDVINQAPNPDPTLVDPVTAGLSLTAPRLHLIDGTGLDGGGMDGGLDGGGMDGGLDGGHGGHGLHLAQRFVPLMDATMGTGYTVDQCNPTAWNWTIQVAYNPGSETFFQNISSRGFNHDLMGNADIDIVTDMANRAPNASDFTYHLDYAANGTHRAVVAVEHGILNLQYKDQDVSLACRWNDSVGCAQVEGATAIPFSVSVDSNGVRSFATSSDPALCTDTFTFTSTKAVASTAGAWDCSNTGLTVYNLSISPMALEDKGGSKCIDPDDHYVTASQDIAACGTLDGATAIACACEAAYTRAIKALRSGYRSQNCKVMGAKVHVDENPGEATLSETDPFVLDERE